MFISSLDKKFNLKEDFGKLLFDLGIFFLPTAISFSIVFLLISSIKNFYKKDLLLADNLNKCFLLTTLLLFLSSLINYFDYDLLSKYPYIENASFLIGLLNWIPLFIFFIGCQPYIKTRDLRRRASFLLLAGTFPVILFGILQAFFEIYGPFKSPLGLIVWYQRPIPVDSFTDITSIFNNQNYFGSWLNIIWPFCLTISLVKLKSYFKKIFALFFIISTPIFLVLTASRGAWLGLFFSLILFFGKNSFKWLGPILLTIIFLCLSIIYPIFGYEFQKFLKDLIPFGLWINILPNHYSNIPLERFDIWNFAFQKILERPLLGFGANTFPNILYGEIGRWRGHAHNLPLELAFSFGLPATISLIIPILSITFISISKFFIFTKNYFEKYNLEKAWLISLMFLLVNHLFDILYFDGRISIALWLLLAGVKNMITETRNSQKEILT